jgi:uncharacterized protein (TIGR02246 family)
MPRIAQMWMAASLMAIPMLSYSAASSDEASIRELQAAQAQAWNNHDAKAYVSLFAEDGDIVNVLGWWWKGQAQMQSKLSAAFSTAFRASQLTITDTDVKFLSPTIAIAHVRWTMVGAKMPPGLPEPKEGIEIQVLRKRAGHWLIESFQNTNGVPERAFPVGGTQAVPAKAN